MKIVLLIIEFHYFEIPDSLFIIRYFKINFKYSYLVP